MGEAREAMQQALDTFESNGDQAGIAQAGLRLAVSYLSTEQGEQVLYWADRILVAATESDDFELHATAEYLMAAGKLYGQHAMNESDAHYREATRLASEHNLDSDIAIQSWFGWGNLSVQCGEYADARSKFERTLSLARSAGNIYFESLGYNNLAYATLLGGDVAAAPRPPSTAASTSSSRTSCCAHANTSTAQAERWPWQRVNLTRRRRGLTGRLKRPASTTTRPMSSTYAPFGPCRMGARRHGSGRSIADRGPQGHPNRRRAPSTVPN